MENLITYTIEVDQTAMRPGRFTVIGKLRYIARLFPGASSVSRTLLTAADELENIEKGRTT
jgi:hypothetical protein